MPSTQLVSRASLEQISWWGDLSAYEQRTVLIATQSLSSEMQQYGLSKLAIGKELVTLREILEPRKKFCDYLRKNFPTCSVATAYRWIENYEIAKEKLPEGFLRVAMAQGYHVIDAEMIERLPPPRTQDRAKIIAYLAKLKTARKVEVNGTEPAADPEMLLREAFNMVRSRYFRLPEDGRTRLEWLRSLFGMLLSEMGGGKQQAFAPVEVPQEFRIVRGRPRNVA